MSKSTKEYTIVVKGVKVSEKVKPASIKAVAKKQLQAWATAKRLEYGLLVTTITMDNPNYDGVTWRGMWRSIKSREELQSKGVKIL